MIISSINHINKLKTNNNLFKASPNEKYNKIWIRDNLYMSIAFEAINNKKCVEKIFHGLFHIFEKFEWKIDDVIKEKPTEDYKFLHPLYTKNLKEIEGGWGWKQNDSIGGFLFFVGYLQSQNYNIIYSEHCQQILQKLVNYLDSIKYWEDEDNGMWEENKEIHASSVGACLAGLNEIKSYVYVPQKLITLGKNTLKNLLPNESKTKITDLSLLSLIYPYDIINNNMKLIILNNINKYLEKEKGVIRYKNDEYYNKNNTEASWTMGLPWMAICYHKLGNIKKYKTYIDKTINATNKNIELPELYIEDKYPNENTPLGWSQALLVKALSL